MKILDKIIVPTPIGEKIFVQKGKDEVRKRLYSLIDLRFNQLNNREMLKKINPNDKKYFGTIGEGFFIAQTKSTIGMNEYYYAVVAEGVMEVNNEGVKIEFKIELPEESKSKVRLFTFFSIIAIGIILFKIVDQDLENGWFFIILLMLSVVGIQIWAKYALKSASAVFLKKFNEVMD